MGSVRFHAVGSLFVLGLLLGGCVTGGPERGERSDPCGNLQLDLDAGTLGGLPPTASQEEVKMAFPCWTGSNPDGFRFNYGGGVFAISHDFYFYTHRDFIEVRRGFQGSMDPNLLRMPLDEARLAALLEETPKSGSLPDVWFFDRTYGCLRVELEENWVTELGVHYQDCEAVTDWYYN